MWPHLDFYSSLRLSKFTCRIQGKNRSSFFKYLGTLELQSFSTKKTETHFKTYFHFLGFQSQILNVKIHKHLTKLLTLKVQKSVRSGLYLWRLYQEPGNADLVKGSISHLTPNLLDLLCISNLQKKDDGVLLSQ